MNADLTAQAAAAAAAADYGRPTAVKRGRNPKWPYVPVIDHGRYTAQMKGLAYETRAEAVAVAEQHIEALRRKLAADLLDPRHRALREHYGLPREIDR